MVRVERKVGDKAWFYFGNHHGGELTEGTVVHVFQLEGWGDEHYVVEMPSSIDPVHAVRDPYTVSDAPDKPIGLWRNLKSKVVS